MQARIDGFYHEACSGFNSRSSVLIRSPKFDPLPSPQRLLKRSRKRIGDHSRVSQIVLVYADWRSICLFEWEIWDRRLAEKISRYRVSNLFDRPRLVE